MKGQFFKRDRYSRARGGESRLLDVACAMCQTHICFYRKDGPGLLKRMYVDRMMERVDGEKEERGEVKPRVLVCAKCKTVMGVPMVYEKENRPAYRLVVGAVAKKIVKRT